MATTKIWDGSPDKVLDVDDDAAEPLVILVAFSNGTSRAFLSNAVQTNEEILYVLSGLQSANHALWDTMAERTEDLDLAMSRPASEARN